MLILTFEEFNKKFIIDNNAMSDIRIKDKCKYISLTPIEIVMRDDKPEMVSVPNSNIIVNLHPTEGTHWVLVIRREDGPTYYFDSFGVETPPLFLEEHVDLGSNERIQQYDESYCGAYCLYMIYLIDRGFRIKSALNILVNQCKYPRIYNECSCSSCSRGDVNDLRSSFANNVNDNDNVNDLRSSFANNDNVNVLTIMIMLTIILMLMLMIMLMIMIMIIREPASQMIYEVALLIMIMIMIVVLTLILIMIIREPASQMIYEVALLIMLRIMIMMRLSIGEVVPICKTGSLI